MANNYLGHEERVKFYETILIVQKNGNFLLI